MEPAIRYCPRCSKQLTALEDEKQPRGFLEELFLLISGNIFVDVIVVALVAVGFVFWFAWIAAIVILVWGYFAAHRRPARYSCSGCGISFPRDMVLHEPKANAS
jgi:hypothetical protein